MIIIQSSSPPARYPPPNCSYFTGWDFKVFENRDTQIFISDKLAHGADPADIVELQLHAKYCAGYREPTAPQPFSLVDFLFAKTARQHLAVS